MKIIVFDVPAESGGALTVLNQYYNEAVKDKKNDWIFVVSITQLNEHKNVKILSYPWIKKSWLHRLFFDRFVGPKLVQKHEVDEILSLQNVIIPNVKVKQTLYLHQSLPFSEEKFRLRKNFKFWIYQNIIGRMIFKSIKQADKVIVQTKWIRDAAIKKTGVEKEKFILKQPKLNIAVKKKYSQDESHTKLFFYPASGMEYKNHRVIVNACIELARCEINNYKVVFTVEGNENKELKNLYDASKNYNLPIEFIGSLNIEEVYEYYSKSILLFPSYIETFGLPLLEAREHGAPIIVSDCAFSHEILDDYNKASFFNPFDSQELKKELKLALNQQR